MATVKLGRTETSARGMKMSAPVGTGSGVRQIVKQSWGEHLASMKKKQAKNTSRLLQ